MPCELTVNVDISCVLTKKFERSLIIWKIVTVHVLFRVSLMSGRNEMSGAHMSGRKGYHIASNWPIGQRASHGIEYSVELAM